MSYLKLALKVVEHRNPDDINPSTETKESKQGNVQRPKTMLIERNASTQESITIWSNPFPKGTPDAKQESFKVIEEAIGRTHHDKEPLHS